MKIRLNILKIANFVGLSRAEIVFAKPVTMFFGPNNAGKSSIKDAINFALTGKARHAGTFTAAKSLAHKGRRGMSVELSYQLDGLKEVCTKTRATKNISKDVDDNILLPYCFDGMRFIELTPKERGHIFASVLDKGNVDVIKEAIKKHVTFTTKLRDEVKVLCKNVLDVDAIRDTVIEIRKGLKRERAVFADIKEPQKSDFNLLPTHDDLAVTKEQETLRQLKVDLMQEHKTASEHNQRQAKVHSTKKELGALRKQLRDIPNGASDLIANVQAKEDLISLLELMSISGVCPCCGRSISKEAAIKRGNEIFTAIDEEKEKLGKLSGHIEKNRTLTSQIESLSTKLESLETMELPEPKRNEDEIQKDVDDLNTKLSGLDEIKRSLDRYDGALQEYDEFVDAEPALNERIKECDNVDKLLADGGPVKAEIAKAGRTLPINRDLISAWDIDSFEWNTNGEISYLGQPIEAASVSEKYRVAQVLALALAEIGDVGFACVDGYEVLCQPHAGHFIEAVENSKLSNVLLFTSMSPKRTQNILEEPERLGDGVNAYAVIDGAVQPVR